MAPDRRPSSEELVVPASIAADEPDLEMDLEVKGLDAAPPEEDLTAEVEEEPEIEEVPESETEYEPESESVPEVEEIEAEPDEPESPIEDESSEIEEDIAEAEPESSFSDASSEESSALPKDPLLLDDENDPLANVTSFPSSAEDSEPNDPTDLLSGPPSSLLDDPLLADDLPKPSPRDTNSRALGALLDGGEFGSSSRRKEKAAEDDKANKFVDELASSTGISVLPSSVLSSAQKSLDKTREEAGGEKISGIDDLVRALKDEDNEDGPKSQKSPKSSNVNMQPESANEVADGISDALDRLLDEASQEKKGRTPVEKPEFEFEDVFGTSSTPEPDQNANPEMAAAIDKWLDEDDEPAPSKPQRPSLSELDDSSDEIEFPKLQQPKPTSTSDALSRLLEAASKAPDMQADSANFPPPAARRSAQEIAAMVNKPPTKISRQLSRMTEDEAKEFQFRDEPDEPKVFEGAGVRELDFSNPQSISSALGGETSSTGTGSTIDQDAVNARIAALQKKMEEQSASQISLDQLPDALPPDPSIVPDQGRRDVINRIMEEGGRQPGGAPAPAPSPSSYSSAPSSSEGFSSRDLEDLSSNRLQQMAELEAKRAKANTGRSLREAQGYPADPRKIIAIVVVGVVVVAAIFFQKPILEMFNSMGQPSKEADAARDAKLIAEVDELVKGGKLTDAKELLENEDKARGLTQELWDKLDTIYIQLARYHYEKAGRQKVAVTLLERINTQSSKFQEAQQLIKEYKKPKSTKKKSRRRKRR